MQALVHPAEGTRRAVTFALDTHPLLREHFGAELRVQHEAGRREGHRRLYAYLCATTKDKPEPTSKISNRCIKPWPRLPGGVAAGGV